jgi:hypothetical protein
MGSHQKKTMQIGAAAAASLIAAGFAVAQPCEPAWDLTLGGLESLGTVNALATFDAGSGTALYVGGLFQTPHSRIARWNNGTWEHVGGGVNNAVRTLKVLDLGSGPSLYVGGDFTIVDGWLQAERIARWDGLSWHSLGNLAGGLVTTRAITTFDDGTGIALYAGGSFITADTVTVNRVAKWDGSQWFALADGLNNHVYDLAGFDDGTGPALYAVGTFTASGGGTPISRFAKWDGQQWSQAGGGLGSSGLVMRVYDDGSGEALFIGGAFTTAGPIAASRIARWDGQQWSALGAGVNNMVNALTAFDDGSGTALYAAGLFNQADGNPVQFAARWDGASWSALNGGPNGGLMAATVFEYGSAPALVVGGSFLQVNGQPANRIAAWMGCPPAGCYADCNGDGTLNVDDFLCFINEFAAAQSLQVAQQIDHYANCDGSSTEPILSVDDFMCFINQFAAGCP